MRQCPNCKTENPDDARFCKYCGMRLPESKDEILYSELSGLEETPKVDFSDQELEEISEEISEKVSEKLPEKLPENTQEKIPESVSGSQIEIPDNLGERIEQVTKEELEQELHRKIKLKEKDIAEQKKNAESIDEPTRMIADKEKEEADEPTRMFTGDIGDFIKKKKDYEEVPEEDAYEEILQSWERKRKEKKIKREREGKDPSGIPKFIREKKSWSELTEKQKKTTKKVIAAVVVFLVFCGVETYYNNPNAVIRRYCKAYAQENWKRTGKMSDIPDNDLATLDEYVSYMENHAVKDVSDYQLKETKDDRQTKIESGGKKRSFTVIYKNANGDQSQENVQIEKQKHKKFFLFANWKISTDQMIARDYNLYIPSGAAVWVDDIELTDSTKEDEKKESLEQYKISLFEGEHKIKVKVPWFRTYESTFQASDKGSMTVARMKVSKDGKKKLNQKMKRILKQYIEAAKAGKAFAEVSGLFDESAMKDPDYKKENKEFYNDLKENLVSKDGYVTEDIGLDQYEGKYVISGVTGVVRGTLDYHYTVTYQQSEAQDSSDGSTTMSAEFVYKDGDYKLLTVDPGSIWYRQ